MESLVYQFGISHRIISGVEKGIEDLLPIDYKRINEKLNQERIFSKSFLANNLKSCS